MVIGILALTIIIGYFNSYYAIGLVWSFGHGETSIAWWIKIHVYVWWAILIASACSTVTTYGWWYLFNDPKFTEFVKKYWDITPKEERFNKKWYYRWLKKFPYLTLPFISFEPTGGVWISMIISKFFRLNKTLSFILITIGNVAKMICWGLGINFMLFVYDFAHKHPGIMYLLVAVVSFKLGSLITLFVQDYLKNRKQMSPSP